MGYKVKWVEDNLGISRKALRNFEKVGLMTANKDNKAREYTDEDIERIWTIRLFQGMGYTLRELSNLSEISASDFAKSLDEKIKKMEAERAELDDHIGYAKAIQLTGRFPAKPKVMGTTTFEKFHEESLEQWNINNDPATKEYKDLYDRVSNMSESEWQESDIGQSISVLMKLKDKLANADLLFMEQVLPREILKRKERGAQDEEIQLLIKMLYENRMENSPSYSGATREQFARFESSTYVSPGDFAEMRQREFGKENCLFIADALAVFGGYSCYDEVKD